MKVHRKVAVVTGGSSGIGFAAAAAFAAQDFAVMICGLGELEVSTATAALNALGGNVIGLAADVTDETQVRHVIGETVSCFGGIDILVTAAGIQRYGTVADTPVADWDLVLDVNVKGTFLVIKQVLPHLRSAGGSIVIVSSVQAFVAQASVAAYTASKGALNALARSIAIDEAQYGIRVNTVCPASVDTPMLRAAARAYSDGTDEGAQQLIQTWGRMHPLGRIAAPEEVAAVIEFLASDRASFVTGISMPVDGGLLATVAVALPQ